MDSIPLWALSLFTILLILGCFEVGYRFGRRQKREEDGALGTLVGGGMGLLAFFLAFTFEGVVHDDSAVSASNWAERSVNR